MLTALLSKETWVSLLKAAKVLVIVLTVAAIAASGFYISHLRNRVVTLQTDVVRLKAVEKSLRDGIAAVEKNAADTAKRKSELQVTHKEIDRAPDAPNPAPIERALDGLRDRQKR